MNKIYSAVSVVPLPGRRGPCCGRPRGPSRVLCAGLPDFPRVGELLIVGDAAQEVLQLVVGHVARPDERPGELDDGPHDHQKPARRWRCSTESVQRVFPRLREWPRKCSATMCVLLTGGTFHKSTSVSRKSLTLRRKNSNLCRRLREPRT